MNAIAKHLEAAAAALVVAVLAVLLGGVYAIPAAFITSEREPWLTVLLGAGLSLSVCGVGAALHGDPLVLSGVWAGSLVLLLVCRRVSRHVIENFAVVHLIALLTTVLTSTWNAAAV